ncbi:MAG: T9SS type A sorting domain-containing protein [Crocinitomicaceae bacterium]|nr:T9SS type A sorting domain-containing protein [Crocinitomicaceae bacterium]
MDNSLILDNMGSNKQYHVEWYNALTGEFIVQQEYPSSFLLGKLELSFPDTLTGNSISPIFFFTVHPAGGSLKMSEQDTTKTEKIIINLDIDSTAKEINPTVWHSQNVVPDIIFNVSPNPATDILTINVTVENLERYSWFLMSENGNIVIENSIISKCFTIDLSHFETGNYYFVLKDNVGNKYTQKIIKL